MLHYKLYKQSSEVAQALICLFSSRRSELSFSSQKNCGYLQFVRKFFHHQNTPVFVATTSCPTEPETTEKTLDREVYGSNPGRAKEFFKSGLTHVMIQRVLAKGL